MRVCSNCVEESLVDELVGVGGNNNQNKVCCVVVILRVCKSWSNIRACSIEIWIQKQWRTASIYMSKCDSC